MPTVTVSFGVALILLGLISKYGTGTTSPTALIPAYFGIVLAALGILGRNPRYLKHAMHAAAVVGLLGFLGGLMGIPNVLKILSGQEVARPVAAVVQTLMAALMGVFLFLCIQSFRAARRARQLQA